METKILKIDENRIDPKEVEAAGSIIKRGGLVAFPTETVYGLGGNALDPAASRKIYAAKGRPSDNPLIVHIYRIEDLYDIAVNVSDDAAKLADKFWPGPLTMIFDKKDIVPEETTGGLKTVAVRMPDNRIAAEFIRASGGFVAAPSANLSGRPSATLAEHVIEDMDGRIEMIIDGGFSVIGLESTIVDMTGDVPMILRPGYISGEMIRDVLGRVDYDPAVFGEYTEGLRPKAPGMRYRHYAPKGDLTVFEGTADAVINAINKAVEDRKAEGYSTGVMASEEFADRYVCDNIKILGSREHEEEIAAHLFDVLRSFDTDGTAYIFGECFTDGNLSAAIMNRLIKAAGYHIIKV